MKKKLSYKLLVICFVLILIVIIVDIVNTYNSQKSSEYPKIGVIYYDEDKASDEYILFNSQIINKKGEIILKPQNYFDINGKKVDFEVNDYIKKLENSSAVVFVIALKNGNILTMERNLYPNSSILFDDLVERDLFGNEILRWSTFNHSEELNQYKNQSNIPEIITLNKSERKYMHIPDSFNLSQNEEIHEMYHMNSVIELPETLLGKKDRRFQSGNLLVSLRQNNLIFIIDTNTKKVVWKWGPGNIIRQHSPIMLENGNIIVYDNGAIKKREFTRIIEIDPVSESIVWEYKANPPASFFAPIVGYAQKMQNNNFLITDGTHNRIFLK